MSLLLKLFSKIRNFPIKLINLALLRYAFDKITISLLLLELHLLNLGLHFFHFPFEVRFLLQKLIISILFFLELISPCLQCLIVKIFVLVILGLKRIKFFLKTFFFDPLRWPGEFRLWLLLLYVALSEVNERLIWIFLCLEVLFVILFKIWHLT